MFDFLARDATHFFGFKSKAALLFETSYFLCNHGFPKHTIIVYYTMNRLSHFALTFPPPEVAQDLSTWKSCITNCTSLPYSVSG